MKRTLLALTIAAASSPAFASEQGGTEAYLGLQYTDWSNERNLDNQLGGALGLSVPVSEQWSIEAWLSRTETEQDISQVDVSADIFSINGLRYLDDGGSSTRTFFTVGASHYDIEPDDGKNQHDNTIDFGVGFKHYFSNQLVLRGDAIARTFEGDDHDLELEPALRLSIGYSFGHSEKASNHTPEAPKPTIAQQPVAQQPVDSDGDGVFNEQDQCPSTPSHLKVDANGCKILLSETVSIDLNITFPNDSSVIPSAYLSEIQKVAEFLQQYSGTVVQLRGYTDNRGSAAYNQQLSERRAKSVANALREQFGIASNRVSSIGFGEENPIADNSTAEGRAANRRVVAEIDTRIEKTITK